MNFQTMTPEQRAVEQAFEAGVASGETGIRQANPFDAVERPTRHKAWAEGFDTGFASFVASAESRAVRVQFWGGTK